MMVIELVLGRLLTGDLLNSYRILYTDNYYTSIALAVTLLAIYGIILVGTYSPKKNAKQANDSFPFAKLTTADAKAAKRGWMRRTWWCVAATRRRFSALCGKIEKCADL